jgi:hypothetical protein
MNQAVVRKWSGERLPWITHAMACACDDIRLGWLEGSVDQLMMLAKLVGVEREVRRMIIEVRDQCTRAQPRLRSSAGTDPDMLTHTVELANSL